MDKFLKELIAKKEARLNEIREAIKNSNDINEVRSLGAEKESVENEIAEARAQLSALDTRGNFNPIATYGNKENNVEANIEYRMAFAKFVVNGTKIPTELRANTLTTDVGTVIPENLLPNIITTIESFGMVLPLITKTSYAVGQTIAIDGAKPVASWVAEGATSDKQKKTLSGTIVFGAFKLRCEISFSQEVSVQTLPAFEALFVKQVGEAMAKAIEEKVVSANNGTSAPTGILYNASNNDKAVNKALGYDTLCEAEGLLPVEYEAGAKWFMSKPTFMAIYGLTDQNGQPIGRVNYGIGGKPERYLLGREVVITPYIANHGVAEAGTVVAFLFNPSDYVLNTSYDLGIQRKQDWDTEDHYVKAVMSVDGKVIDRNSLVVVKKSA